MCSNNSCSHSSLNKYSRNGSTAHNACFSLFCSSKERDERMVSVLRLSLRMSLRNQPAAFFTSTFYPALFIRRPFLSSAFLSGAFLNRMPFKTALSQKTRNQRTFQHSTNLSRAIVHPIPIYFRRFNSNLIPLCTNATMGQNPILRPSRSYQQPRGDILTMYPLTNRSIYQRIFLTMYVLTDALAGR